ncbi:VOC family protein [Reyranella sp. CPCC 100927]|uniref:VOC family protein n=1 Tax=Reyranella sp. CPCC 100927 TaxID=2599616 RepID=UPI0011B5396F|nr:VOC family protein [Reyranella sp. CPCC 100927]TWT13685.1 dioxygenase [Reyranella sp. CPCC 100927]
MRPIFHLSFPVTNMETAIHFYVSHLGAEVGRQAETFTDILLFGAQITLQNDSGNVTAPMPRSRHFGATIAWDHWERLAHAFKDEAFVVEPAKVSYQGQPIEQGKFMLRDPSSNFIEIKAYRSPSDVLGALADQ